MIKHRKLGFDCVNRKPAQLNRLWFDSVNSKTHGLLKPKTTLFLLIQMLKQSRITANSAFFSSDVEQVFTQIFALVANNQSYPRSQKPKRRNLIKMYENSTQINHKDVNPFNLYKLKRLLYI